MSNTKSFRRMDVALSNLRVASIALDGLYLKLEKNTELSEQVFSIATMVSTAVDVATQSMNEMIDERKEIEFSILH